MMANSTLDENGNSTMSGHHHGNSSEPDQHHLDHQHHEMEMKMPEHTVLERLSHKFISYFLGTISILMFAEIYYDMRNPYLAFARVTTTISCGLWVIVVCMRHGIDRPGNVATLNVSYANCSSPIWFTPSTLNGKWWTGTLWTGPVQEWPSSSFAPSRDFGSHSPALPSWGITFNVIVKMMTTMIIFLAKSTLPISPCLLQRSVVNNTIATTTASLRLITLP